VETIPAASGLILTIISTGKGKVFLRINLLTTPGKMPIYTQGDTTAWTGERNRHGVGLSVGKGVLLADARYGVGLNHLVKRHTKYITVSNRDWETGRWASMYRPT
jgi:hypothetical protein